MTFPFPSSNPGNAVVVSPDPGFREEAAAALRESNWQAEEAVGGAEALAKLDANRYQALILDGWLADLDVNEVAEIARKRHPGISVYLRENTRGFPGPNQETESSAPESPITATLESLCQAAPTSERRIHLAPAAVPAVALTSTQPTPEDSPLPDMIGQSPAMREVYGAVRLVAPRVTTVLILGGTGTGKELVARAVHVLSPRGRQPFVTVNCAAIPETLLEAELFGHARGAFTGAVQARIGRLHAAHGGTLFLDEVGDLPLSMQAKLLRFLQDGEVQRLGSSEVLRVDVRVIGATNVDLAERVRQKAFREDLYYRLSVFPIEIQPLQKRVEDIVPLSLHFLRGFCRETGTLFKRMSSDAQAILEQHSWPGNVRELRHVIERAFILSGNRPEILREHIRLQPVQ